MAASFLAILRVFATANPEKVQHTPYKWIGGKQYVRGPGPRLFLDEVLRVFGPSPIIGAGPGPPIVPQRCLEGRCAGPGPGDIIGPGPKSGV